MMRVFSMAAFDAHLLTQGNQETPTTRLSIPAQ